MNNTYSLSKISKTGSLDSSLILRQYKIDLMARFMEIKAMNPRLTQNEIAKELGYPSATVKRFRYDINMPPLYRTQSNTNKRKQKFSNDVSNNESEPRVNPDEPKRVQKELAKTESNIKTNEKSQNILKAGSINDNIEINDDYLDTNIHNNNIKMNLAMQFISIDKQ